MRLIRLALCTLVLGCLSLLSALPVGAAPVDQSVIVGVDQEAALEGLRFVRNRPSVLITTDYYTYGVAPFGSSPLSRLWIDDNNYGDPVFVYFYLVNRETGAATWMTIDPSTGDLELTGTETALFGTAGSPVAVPVPTLTNQVLFGSGGIFGDYPGPTSTGHYMLVWEFRDTEGRAISRDNAMFTFVDSVVQISGGDISSQTWTANNAYLLANQTFIPNGATLTIEPGTVVLGTAGTVTSLGTRQGGTLIADCTNLLPCRYTSDQRRPDRRTGDFGGIHLNGFAVVNIGTPEGEGNSGTYGGSNNADSSGIMRYNIVEFAGFNFTAEDQLNCIALQGTGSGTVLEHLQCTNGQDDGFEFFGGTANASYLVGLNNEDDTLDWTSGWVGTVDKVCAVQNAVPPGSLEGAHDRCIEADNEDPDNDLLPRSNPTVSNFLCAARKANDADGVVLRRGTAVQGQNWAILDPMQFGVDVNGDASQALVDQAGGINVDAVVENADDGPSNVPITGVVAGSVFHSNSLNRVQPLLAPSSGGRGCDTRSEYWTSAEWINWDWGLGTTN